MESEKCIRLISGEPCGRELAVIGSRYCDDCYRAIRQLNDQNGDDRLDRQEEANICNC